MNGYDFGDGKKEGMVAPPPLYWGNERGGSSVGPYATALTPEPPKIIPPMDYKEVIRILVYFDEDDQKYLDTRTLMFLLEKESSNRYKYPDGSEVIVSDLLLREDPYAVPDGWTSREDVVPDIPSDYPYDEQTGLYLVTDQQLAELIAMYEARHPNIKIKPSYEKIEKYNNKEKEDYDFYDEATVYNKDSDSQLGEDSIKYNNDSKYSDGMNVEKIRQDEMDSMIKENSDKYSDSDSHGRSF